MGKTVPPKGWQIRFQRSVRPTLPAFSVAPITAMLLGSKMALRGWCCLYRKTVLGAALPEADSLPVFLVSIRLWSFRVITPAQASLAEKQPILTGPENLGREDTRVFAPLPIAHGFVVWRRRSYGEYRTCPYRL